MVEGPPYDRRKPLPHSRSFSLQMLTSTPSSAPLETRMYSEALQPIRPPPSYPSSDGLAPALARLDSEEMRRLRDPTAASPRYTTHASETSRRPTGRPFEGDAALPASRSYRNDRPNRAVSMPAPASSPYDALFSFPSALPDDFVGTLALPSGPASPSDPRQAGGVGPQGYSPSLLRETYIQGHRSVSSPQPPTLRGDNSRGSSRASARPGERPATGPRRPSMLNTLGSWLDKR